MNYNEVIEELVKSIKQAIDGIKETLSYDKTFRAKVTEKINDRKYKILYCGTTYTVSSSILCEVGDFVRVCAPCNNWKDLFIIHNRTR